MGYTKSVASLVAPVPDPALFPRRVFLFNLLALIPVKTSPPAQTPLQWRVVGIWYLYLLYMKFRYLLKISHISRQQPRIRKKCSGRNDTISNFELIRFSYGSR